jgi:hypothetical protein
MLCRALASLDLGETVRPLRRFRWAAALTDRRGYPDTPRPGFNVLLAVLLLGLTVLISPWVRPQLQRGTGLLASGTPVGAVDYLAEHDIRGNIFHAQIYGDYLVWRLWPQQQSFIDSRTHIFNTAVLNDFQMAFVDPNWQQRLAKYDIRLVLLEKADPGSRRMIQEARASPEWRSQYEDDLSVLFEKTSEAH